MTAPDPDQLFFAAHAKRAAGDLAGAERLLNQAAALQPKSASVQTALAEVQLAAGRPSQALEAAGRAVTLDRTLAPAHVAFGEAAGQLGNGRTALKHHRIAVELQPTSVGATVALLRTLKALTRETEAADVLTNARTAMAGDATPLNNLGAAALDLGYPDAARRLFAAAHDAAPEDAGILVNLARAADRCADDEAAAATVDAALTLAPEDFAVRRAAGLIAVNAGRPQDALTHLDAALAMRPGDTDALLARGLAHLTIGDWKNGWTDYEARLDASRGPGRRRFKAPRWSAGMKGGTVLLHAEQGAGDTIQFVRYAEAVKATGATTVVQVQANLVELIRTGRGVDMVLGPTDPPPVIDAEAPLPSLPGILGATPDTPAVTVPYLSAPAGPMPALPSGDGSLVGLVWAGNPAFTNDRRRSPGLKALEPVLAVEGVRFVGLQVGSGAASHPRIHDLSAALTDYAATARIVAALDLVITSDTSVAHLAGALGRSCWLLLSTAPDFRWGLAGGRTDWYPSLTIFRQEKPGDWSAPAADIAARLTTL